MTVWGCRLVPVVVLIVAGAAACGDNPGQGGSTRPLLEDLGPVHVHGLGVNPSDDALYIAAHTGLFRLKEGQPRPTRVAGRYQDTMGFAVIGPDRFLGSGHPDSRENLPPFLGLIESRDSGRSWKPLSLLGEVDFHALAAGDKHVYGYGTEWKSRNPVFLASSNGGESWVQRATPEPLGSMAVHPNDPKRVLASGGERLYQSSDGGARWRRVDGRAGLVAGPEPNRVLVAASDGALYGTERPGSRWERRGQIGGEPRAFTVAQSDFYAALHDGSIRRSRDGGASWELLVGP